MSCQPQVYNKVTQPYTHTHTHTYTHIYSLCIFSSIIGYHRILSTAPCTTQHVKVGRLLHTQQCVYSTSKLPVHPSQAPTTTSLLFMSVGLFLFCKLVHLCPFFFFFFKILHINDALWYLSFSVWLTSAGMIISRST